MYLKKIISSLIFLSLLFYLSALVVPQKVYADSDYGLTATQKSAGLPDNIKGQTNLIGVVGLVVKLLLSLVGVFFLGLMLYAGIVWMKSMGASEDVERSKEIIQSAIIGLIIVSAAYAITSFVFSGLSGSAETTNNPPQGSKGNNNSKKDGDACKIADDTYGAGLTGLDGQWNCGKNKGQTCDAGAGECQPECRYKNGVAKNPPNGGVCLPSCTVPAATSATCPNSASCCAS